MNVSDLKKEVQLAMLKDICQQIAKLPDDWLENNGEGLLAAIADILDDQSQDDAWGTEGWQHFFGYED